MIDLHTHVLPGIDDGPESIEGSIALVRAAAAQGTTTIVATPHVSWHYQNDAETIERLTIQLNERLQTERIELEVHAGAEIAMTRVAELDPSQLVRLRLGDGPWVLLEPPFSPIVSGIEQVLAKLQSLEHRVLLAHPERCPAFQRDPELVKTLVKRGALTSITAGSLTGHFGKTVQSFSRQLLDRQLVHNVASDTHDTIKRPPGIAEDLRQAGLLGLADWLTREVPAAILSGGEIPAQPASAPSPSASGVRLGRLRWRRR